MELFGYWKTTEIKHLFSSFVPEYRRKEVTNKELSILLAPSKAGESKEEVSEVLDELFKALTPEQYKVMYTKYRSTNKVLANWRVGKLLGKSRWNVWKIHRRAMATMMKKVL